MFRVVCFLKSELKEYNKKRMCDMKVNCKKCKHNYCEELAKMKMKYKENDKNEMLECSWGPPSLRVDDSNFSHDL